MDEEVLQLYKTLELASTSKDDLKELNNRIRNELKQELKEIDINKKIYKLSNYNVKSNDIYYIAEEQNNFIEAIENYYNQLNRIINNKVSLDKLDMSKFLIEENEKIKLDFTSSEKINSFTSYLKTFNVTSKIIYTNIDDPENLFLYIINDSNIDEVQKTIFNSYFFTEVDYEELKTLVLELLTSIYGQYYISNKMFRQLLSYITMEIQKRTYKMAKHDKQMSVLQTILLIGIPAIIFGVLGIVFEVNGVYFTKFRWYFWLLYILLIAAVSIALRLIDLIFNNFDTDGESPVLKALLGLIFSIVLAVLFGLLSSENSIGMLITSSACSIVQFLIMVLKKDDANIDNPSVHYVLFALCIPFIALIFHEYLGCMITMCVLYTSFSSVVYYEDDFNNW